MDKNSIDFESFLKRTGLTLSDVSKKIGVSKSMMTLLNNGSTTPSYSTLMKFHRLGMAPHRMRHRLFRSSPWTLSEDVLQQLEDDVENEQNQLFTHPDLLFV